MNASPANAIVAAANVTKRFGDLRALNNVSLTIAPGTVQCIIGPSGSGKSTLLRCINQLEKIDQGAIWVDGQLIGFRIKGDELHELSDAEIARQRLSTGMVFQRFNLFNHMTVLENIIEGPVTVLRRPRQEAIAEAEKLLARVGLSEKRNAYPIELSGGQQQRIALSRALVYEPKVVLMDEPLSALDKQLREHMQLEIRALHRELGLTVIFVTHDQGEALTMSDRVAVLNRGKIEQFDTPSGLYDRPRTRFVAEFIGETNLLAGRVAQRQGEATTVALASGGSVTCDRAGSFEPDSEVMVSVRPEMLHLVQDAAAANALPVTVEDHVYHGDHIRLHLAFGESRLVARAGRRDAAPPVGSTAFASFAPGDCSLVAP